MENEAFCNVFLNGIDYTFYLETGSNNPNSRFKGKQKKIRGGMQNPSRIEVLLYAIES